MRVAKRTYSVSAGAVGAHEWIHLDHHIDSFNVQYAVTIDTSGVCEPNYTIQYTLDDVLKVGAPTPVAFDVTAALSADASFRLNEVATGLRVNVNGVSGAGSADLTFRVLQAGN